MLNEIILFENQNVKLEVNVKDETVWLTQGQMSELFHVDRTGISRHIKNIYKEKELVRDTTCAKFAHMGVDGDQLYETEYYNLDVIISVGYRVKSQNGIIFRKWANSVLKDYLLKGYSVNQKRLEYLEKTVKLIDIASRSDETNSILRVIGDYSKALDLLDDYDHRTVKKVKGNNSDIRIDYHECMSIISQLKFNESSNLFALERNHGLEGIINDIYQTFDGKDVYESIEEKASNFLYMIVKNHVFIDGNKRIAATLFIYFLHFYNLLYKDSCKIIDNNTLTSLTLLIAQSNPKEKDIIIDLVMNFLIV